MAVDVRQVVRSLDGAVPADGPTRHVYSFRGDLVLRMDVEAPAQPD